MAATESTKKTLLVIVDPQNDFHPKDPNNENSHAGSLGIAGALEDAQRLATLINEKPTAFDDIIVTMDTHPKFHVAHSLYWRDASGNHPGPFTTIKAEQIENGEFTTSHPEHKERALDYCKKLEAGGRFVLIIWPYHCILGTPGHGVTPAIMNSLNNWADSQIKPIEYVFKGTNPHTEMYSFLQAEVSNEDPSTQLNTALLEKMKSYDRVVFCGQARSHCVNFSCRDFINNGGDASKVVLLTDCQSSVAGFEESGVAFYDDLKEAGATLVTSCDFE